MKKRRRDWFFDDFFRDFEEIFEEDIARIFEEAERRSREGGADKPFVYGFSMKVGPGGEPKIERFGNVPNERSVSGEREPLVDVFESASEVRVVAEIPGVEKEDIQLDVLGKFLDVRVDSVSHRYSKRISLPCEVVPDSAKATYKNGVLDVRFSRAERRPDSFRVDIE